MKTLTLLKPGSFELTDAPAPTVPGPGEALIRIHRVGICGTDIHAFRGEQPFFTYPRVLGHELGVEVIAVGVGVTDIKPGDRCAVEPYMTCGDCPPCRRGQTNCCESLKCLGVHTDGGMREQIVIPADKLHQSDRLGFDALALVETLGIGKHAVDRAMLNQGDRVAVLGLGPIGLTVATFAQIAGAEVVGVDVSAKRAEAARALLGIQTLAIDADTPVRDLWIKAHGSAPPVVFDATGNRRSMQNAFTLPGHGGRLVFVGLVLGELAFNDPEFHRKELTLLASRNAVGRDFKQIIALIEAGTIDVGPWVTHRCDAGQLPDVFDDWLKPDAGLLKGVVSF